MYILSGSKRLQELLRMVEAYRITLKKSQNLSKIICKQHQKSPKALKIPDKSILNTIFIDILSVIKAIC